MLCCVVGRIGGGCVEGLVWCEMKFLLCFVVLVGLMCWNDAE